MEDRLRQERRPGIPDALPLRLLDDWPEQVLVLDETGRIVYHNEAARRVLDLRSPGILGRPWRDLPFPAGYVRVLESHADAVRASGAFATGRVPGEEGPESPTVMFRLYPLGEEPAKLLAVFSDVSPIVRTRRRLRESEERYELLVEGIRDHAIFLLDADGRIATWDAGAELITGYRRAEIIGRPYSIFFAPEDQAAGRPERILSIAAAEGRYEEECTRLKKDGTRFQAAIRLTALRDEEGHLQGYAKITRDVTHKHREERKFQNLLEGAPDAMVIVDGQGRISLVNHQALALFGYGREELLGRPVEMLIPERFRKAHGGHRAAFVALPSTRPMGTGLDLYGLRKNGTEFPAEISLSPLEVGSGILVTAAIRDITERLQAEEERRRTAAQLFQGQKLQAIGQLAAGIAHEVNNPTGYILSNMNSLREYFDDLLAYLAALEDALGDPGASREALSGLRTRLHIGEIAADIPKAVADCTDGAGRIRDIVRDLRDFARMEDAAREPADLNDILRKSIRLVRNEIKYKATLDCDFADLPSFDGFPQRLVQVFVNLLVNAAQSIPERGAITVTTRADASGVEARIRDTGEGIPAEHLKHLFEPFFTTKPVGKGTGLGLHVAYKIVAAHGGEIRVDSEPGRGSEFTVRFPIAPART